LIFPSRQQCDTHIQRGDPGGESFLTSRLGRENRILSTAAFTTVAATIKEAGHDENDRWQRDSHRCTGCVFACGWFFGAVSQRSADAQLDSLKKTAMDKAGQQGGTVGAAAKLGTSISDIQTHLDALQKNVDTLKSIKSMIGG